MAARREAVGDGDDVALPHELLRPAPWRAARALAEAAAVMEHYDGGEGARAFRLHHLDRNRGRLDLRGVHDRCPGAPPKNGCSYGRPAGQHVYPLSPSCLNMTSAPTEPQPEGRTRPRRAPM